MTTQNTKAGGLFGSTEDGQFPKELLQANKNFEAAMSNCVFRDEAQRNICCLYADHLLRMGLVGELQTVVNSLNGSVSIGGVSRAQAVQSHVGMFYPSTSGMRVSKDELKFMQKTNEDNAKHKRNDHEDEDHND